MSEAYEFTSPHTAHLEARWARLLRVASEEPTLSAKSLGERFGFSRDAVTERLREGGLARPKFRREVAP